jgi:hypothetical protein
MSKMPSPRADRLREMREAAYEAEQARQAAERKAECLAKKAAKQARADGSAESAILQIATKFRSAAK